MKLKFEKREKEITAGLLAMLTSFAQTEKKKKEYKFSKKVMDKFIGDNVEVNLKPLEVDAIKGILKHVVEDGKKEVGVDELPKMHKVDLDICINLLNRLS